MKSPIYISALLALTMASAAAQAVPQGEVTGEVTYRQRIALPSEAVVTVRLEDVSLADAPSKLISEVRFVSGGKQVPFAYRLPYIEGAIQKGHRYNVRATITLGDRLLFTSTEAHPVINNGTFRSNIVLQQPAQSPVSLKGTAWTLVELNGKPPLKGLSGVPNLNFSEKDNRLTGNGGINRFTGVYKLTGRRSLELQPGAMTLMAGPEPQMKQEKAFVDMLKEVESYRIVNGKLELLNNGRVLARFQR